MATSLYCASILTYIDANLVIIAEYLTNDLVSCD